MNEMEQIVIDVIKHQFENKRYTSMTAAIINLIASGTKYNKFRDMYPSDSTLSNYANTIITGNVKPTLQSLLMDKYNEPLTILMLFKKMIVDHLVPHIPEEGSDDYKEALKPHCEKLSNIIEWMLDNVKPEYCLMFMGYFFENKCPAVPKLIKNGVFRRLLEYVDPLLNWDDDEE